MIGLVGQKLGMTRTFTDTGVSIPTSVILIKDNYITQVKSTNNDGYTAIQVTTGHKKKNKISKSEIGHFKKANVIPGRGLWEFPTDTKKKFVVGTTLTIGLLTNLESVDVVGISKGKGFQGTVKRWNFRTQDMTHGNSLSHRASGSIGQCQTPGRVMKGKKMAGRMGAKQVTVHKLQVINIDVKNKLLLLKGAVPGAVGQDVIIKKTVKKRISNITRKHNENKTS